MKFFGLAGLIALLAVLGIGWKLASNPVVPEVLAGDAAALVDNVPSQSIERDIVRTRQLVASLDGLAAQAFQAVSDAPLIAYSKSSKRDDAMLAKLLDAEGAGPHEQQVSLLYSGTNFNRAVIDGQYVRRGDRLSGGGRVLRITRNSVVVQGSDGRKTLRVPEAPHAPVSAK